MAKLLPSALLLGGGPQVGRAEGSRRATCVTTVHQCAAWRVRRKLGHKLFKRSGRNLVLTEMGQLVLSYADEIFSSGCELMNAVRQRPTKHPLRLNIGLTDAFPKMIAFQILRAAFRLDYAARASAASG